jgi:hypothetical protein
MQSILSSICACYIHVFLCMFNNGSYLRLKNNPIHETTNVPLELLGPKDVVKDILWTMIYRALSTLDLYR